MAIMMVYIHIPFCISKCLYCDFYSETDLNIKKNYLNALKKEIDLRYKNEKVSSIYFGGGTPSLLSSNELKMLIEKFNLSTNCEITIECNPEDLSKEKVRNYIKCGINRFSLGVQSLNDFELNILKRRHNSTKAIEAIKILKENVKNFSCDLIVGIKGQMKETLKETMDKVFSFDPPHISIYALELKKFKYLSENNDRKAELLSFAWKILKKNGYIHYEISNFARDGLICKHNMGYWQRKNYFGFGPSAHSFIGNKRYSNYKSIEKYISKIEKGYLPMKATKRFNFESALIEKIILNLRTIEGTPKKYFEKAILSLLKKDGFITENRKKIYLTEKALLVQNSVLLKLILNLKKKGCVGKTP